MKLLSAIKSGFCRGISAWKVILITWLIYFLLSAIFVFPLKSMIVGAFGKSIITEQFNNGIDADILTDILNNINGLPRMVFSGLFILSLTGIILNAFVSGGLFSSVSRKTPKSSVKEFFAESSVYFWKYFGTTLIMSVLILFAGLFIFVLPVSLAIDSGNTPDKNAFITAYITGGFYFILIGFFILVGDYARASIATGSGKSLFHAIGFSFAETFRNFIPSVPMIFIFILFQILYSGIVLYFIGIWRPESSFGAFLLFLVSQFTFIIRIFIKTARYGGVSSLIKEEVVLNDNLQATVS